MRATDSGVLVGRLVLESFSKITDTAGRRCAVTSQPSSGLVQVLSGSYCIGVNVLGVSSASNESYYFIVHHQTTLLTRARQSK